MNKYKIIIITLVLSIIYSFSIISSNNKKIKRILDYYFLDNEYLAINTFDFTYKNSKIDSLFFNTRVPNKKYTLQYTHYINKIEVFKHTFSPNKKIKLYEYNFNSEKKITNFLTFNNDKLINKDSFIYNKDLVIQTKLTTQYYLWVDSANYFKTIFYPNNSGNIDSSKLYQTFEKDSSVLIQVKRYKYDNNINSFKNLVFLEVNPIFFNTNNIISDYSKSINIDFKETFIYKYEYDKDGYVTKRTMGDFPNSKKSSATKYIY